MNDLPAIDRRALRRLDKAKAPKYLHPEQIKQIINFEYSKRRKGKAEMYNLNKYYVLFSLLWNTGARISEALALRVDDIKSDKQIYFMTEKKGQPASRYIPISEAMYSDLSRYMNENKLPGSALLFDLTPVAVHRELKRVCLAIGAPSWVHVHTFRHSFAINVLNQGIPINVLKELLGHENIETSMIYLKVYQPVIRELLAKVQF